MLSPIRVFLAQKLPGPVKPPPYPLFPLCDLVPPQNAAKQWQRRGSGETTQMRTLDP